MAYLKCYHLNEFIVSSLNNCLNDPERIFKFYLECINNNINFVLPDINKSDFFFRNEGNNIIYGLGGIKGNGYKASEYILKERKRRNFDNFVDFYYRIDRSIVNKKKYRIFNLCRLFF